MEQNAVAADSNFLIRRATEMIQAGRFGAARPIVAALQRLAPGTPDTALLAARIALQDDRLDQARGILDAAIATEPDNVELRKARAEVLSKLDHIAEAAVDAAEAVILDRNDPVAKALLGSALLGLNHPEEAALCFKDALASAATNPSFTKG